MGDQIWDLEELTAHVLKAEAIIADTALAAANVATMAERAYRVARRLESSMSDLRHAARQLEEVLTRWVPGSQEENDERAAEDLR